MFQRKHGDKLKLNKTVSTQRVHETVHHNVNIMRANTANIARHGTTGAYGECRKMSKPLTRK